MVRKASSAALIAEICVVYCGFGAPLPLFVQNSRLDATRCDSKRPPEMPIQPLSSFLCNEKLEVYSTSAPKFPIL
jgi:hypothetical protein